MIDHTSQLESIWREAWRPPDRQPVWQWAEQHIASIPYSPTPGRFRVENSPQIREVLILPWVRVPHLASHVLGRIARRLSSDWQEKYGHRIYLVETFVDTSRFAGACYRAANWRMVGMTTGRTRQNKTMIPQAAPKAVWLYPLRTDFREALCAS